MAAPRPLRQSASARKKAYVETYGCQMNVADGELMQGILADSGFDLASTPDEADVILVNTCAIREHAEQRVIGRVGELSRFKQGNQDVLIGVTGCMAQRLGESLLERAPYVDLVMGPDGYRHLPDALARIAAARVGHAAPVPRRPVPQGVASSRATELPVVDRLAILDFEAAENFEGLGMRRAPGVSAWVTIQRGCDHRCTYCIVPYVRGAEKNREPERVLAEVREIAATGVTEVVLLGQTVNSYRHGEWTFARLLRAVARVDGIRRVRYVSPHPVDVTPELIEVMASEPAVCKQLHLPVQAGHDRTLKRMVRRYTVASYLRVVDALRAAMPGIALSTDVIVAFPGETDAEYQATLDLMRRVRFDDAYMYKFSPRDGTPATRLPADDFIADAVAQARLERLIDLHRGIQQEINEAEVGSVAEVLVERTARSSGDVLGRTESNKVVAFPGDMAWIGRYMHVRLTSTTGATFRGERTHSDRVGRVA